jgi:hypothetical protein
MRGSSRTTFLELQLVSRSDIGTLGAIRAEGAINNRYYCVVGWPDRIRAIGGVGRVIWRKRTITINGKLTKSPYTHHLW